MDFLARLAVRIDTINEWVGRGVSWVTTLMVAVVFVDVVMRYLFATSFVFTQELEWHLFGFIFLIGAGYTLLHDGHVRVDIIYQKLSPKAQAWINLVGCVLFMLPGCLLIIYTSISFVRDAIYVVNLTPQAGHSAVTFVWEGSPDPGGIPLRFLLKACIPVGFTLFLMQGASLFIKSLFIVKGLEAPGLELDGKGAH